MCSFEPRLQNELQSSHPSTPARIYTFLPPLDPRNGSFLRILTAPPPYKHIAHPLSLSEMLSFLSRHM